MAFLIILRHHIKISEGGGIEYILEENFMVNINCYTFIQPVYSRNICLRSTKILILISQTGELGKGRVDIPLRLGTP